MSLKMHTITDRRAWLAECQARGYEVKSLTKDFDSAIAYNRDRTRRRLVGQWLYVPRYGDRLWGNSPVLSEKNTGWVYRFKNPIRF